MAGKNTKTEEEIREWMTAYLADVLQVQPNALSPTTSFYRLGLDSAAAIGMTGDLEIFMGRKMPTSLPYDYPSIGALSRVLADGTEGDSA
jgi:acyl carrier protein